MCPGRTDPSASCSARPCHPGRSAVRAAPPRPARGMSRFCIRHVNVVAQTNVHCSVQNLSIPNSASDKGGSEQACAKRDGNAGRTGRKGRREDRLPRIQASHRRSSRFRDTRGGCLCKHKQKQLHVSGSGNKTCR